MTLLSDLGFNTPGSDQKHDEKLHVCIGTNTSCLIVNDSTVRSGFDKADLGGLDSKHYCWPQNQQQDKTSNV